MSLEALRLVSEYMTPAGRINLAQVDASTCNELIRWEDVHSLLFDDYKVLMAGEVFRHQVESSTDSRDNLQMEQSFRLCPHARHVWIQTRLRNEHIEVLRKRSGIIETLYLSSENFDTRYPLSWDDFTMSRLRSINILQRMDQPLNLRQILDPTACQAFFPITLRHISLTGVVLTPAFMDVLLTLTNLRHLDLIGSVIDSNLAADYVEKLGRLPNLDEMTVPPSMFSFSNQEQSVVSFSFRKLHLSKLSIYMEQFDENTFFEQLESIMPRKLEALVLYGNFFALKKSKKYGQWRKFEIVFGKMTPQVRTQWWMRDDAILMSHLVRSPPYKTADDFRPIRNSNASWRFDQAVADNEEARQARQNQPLNRILRFMRPEPPAPGVAPQRALPEPPPPPPAARRERARRRASNPPAPAAEERRPAPIMFTIPAVDGGNAGPVGVIIPSQAVTDNAAPPAPNLPQGQVQEQRPDPNVAQLPAIPEIRPASDLPGTESNRTTPRDAISSETAPLLAPIQPSPPPPTRNQGNAFPTAIVQPLAHDGDQPPAQSVQIREVPAETPASTNQPQPRVELPGELPPTSSRPQPRDEEPHLFIANVAPAGEQRSNARAANAPNPAIRPGQAPPAEQRHAEQPDGHADEENINMMLQGMLQALVEEIVFDAVNEERMGNTISDPSPAVSTNATSAQRPATEQSSTHRTSAPVTPPPSDASQVSQPPRNRNP